MKTYIANFMKYRYLLTELVKKEVMLKYRRSKLGILWTLIEPILTTIVLATVFSKLRGKADATWPVYILTGRLLYSYFANSTKAAARAIRSNSSMMRKVYVPKYIYPVAKILSNYIIFIISLVVLVGAIVVCKVPVTVYFLATIVPLIILFVMTLGTGLLLATLEVFFQDLEYLWGVICMIIMYCSCIFYEPSLVPADKQFIFELNPLYAVIKNFRNCVLFGSPMDMWSLAYSAIIAVIVLIVGLLAFRKKQDEFILNL